MFLMPKRSPVEIEFHDLSYIVSTETKNERKVILKHIDGRFRSGRLTAIMGPSGAGKTTLMNITAGYRISNVKGAVLTNGRERNIRQFRKMSCYIMQEDHHLPHLSVNEAMDVSANLKIGNTMTSSKKKEVIQDILSTLSLIDCNETRTCNLSGGQKKRLSIALELLSNPPIMFFDEPTSGLDSQNSFQCINLLKSLAEEGRTIVCTIHQPSARLFEKFDYLYTLSDGNCIFRGAVSGLLPFLSSIELECPSYHNPADFLIEVATSEENAQKMVTAVSNGKCANLVKDNDKSDFCSVQEICDNNIKPNFKDSDLCEATTFLPEKNGNTRKITYWRTKKDFESLTENVNTIAASGFMQFRILLRRNFKSILRDSMLTKLRLSSHILLGILIGILFYKIGNDASKVQSNIGFLFCSLLFTIFAGMMPTLLTFPMEMKVFIREHHNCWYSLKAYYIAKTMADIPFQIFYPILFAVIVYFLTGQPMEFDRFSMYTGMCIMVSFVSQSMALGIGAAMEIQEATFFAPVVTIPILLLSGFFVTFSTIPYFLQWITYGSYMRYAFEGIVLSMYGFNREKLLCSQSYCHLKYPEKILESFDLEGGIFWVDCLALFAFFIILRIGGYFVLMWKLRQQR